LGLQLHGNLFVQFGFVVKDRDAGEALTAGVASLPQQGLGRHRARGGAFRRAIARHAPRGEGKGDGLAPTGDLFHDRLLIDGKAEGATDFGVVEGRPGDVEPVKVGGEERGGVEIGPPAQFGHDEGWDQSFVQEDIGLAGGVEVEGGAGAGDGEGVDPVEANPIAGVVMRVLFQGDPVVDPPGLQAVGTAAHPVLRTGPAVAIFFHGGPVDGKIGGEGGEGGKEGDGIF